MWHESDEDLDDEEFPDDLEDDSGETTVACPHCHKPVYEDAEQCPACGKYLSREDQPWSRPVWLVIGVVICLGIVAWWTVR